MNFKEPRHSEEFNRLFGRNQDLYSICIMLDNFTRLEFKKEVTITSILRTQEEHDALYAAVPAESKPPRSPHLYWSAVDIRSKDFTDAEIKRMLDFLNCFKNNNGRPVAIYHAIPNNALHFHIQRFV